MKIVVKLGGSLCMNEHGPDETYFRAAIPVFRALLDEHQLVIGVGGGAFIDAYHRAIGPFDIGNDDKERIFIELLHANARFLAAALGIEPILSLDAIGPATSGVISGIAPGRSTDANAALAAAAIKADLFIKLTRVDGVYTSDPKKDPNARKLETLTYDDLRRYTADAGPRGYGILDRLAIDTLEQAGIISIVMGGHDPARLHDAIDRKGVGSVIVP